MVPKAGLEPARDEALVSKTSMSTNSITWAVYFNFDLQNQKKWWAERDSNPRSRRQRIYSPPHLTALESAQIFKKNRKVKTFL